MCYVALSKWIFKYALYSFGISQDPDGYVMRRWPSRPTNVGVVSMDFRLPFLPKVGWWSIKALINGQEEYKHIRVEKWYTPRFEVSRTVREKDCTFLVFTH